MCNQYGDAVYQMGHRTEDLVDLSQRTVVEPLKKLSGEFVHVQVPSTVSENIIGAPKM